VHDRIVQVHVSSVCQKAVSILSMKNANGEIPLVLIPTARSALSLFMSVPSGVHCIVQRFGKEIGTIDAGLHMLPPWYRIAYIVSKQSTTYDAPVRACPTLDDVRVGIDVVLVFSVTDASKFIFRLGAKNFDDFLSGTVDESIRLLVRKRTHKEVYSLRGDREHNSVKGMLEGLNKKFEECGVTFSSVKITDVMLPDKLADCLESTTKLHLSMARQIRQNEYEMVLIKQESEMAIEEARRKQEQALILESGRKRRAELEFEQRSVKAEEDGRTSLIQAEEKQEVGLLESNAELRRRKVELETWRIDELAEAGARSRTKKIEADQLEEQQIVEAESFQEEMIYDAGVLKAEASTERQAAKLLQHKRKHDYELTEKKILGMLAQDGSFNLIGPSGDKIVSAMLDGSFQAKL